MAIARQSFGFDWSHPLAAGAELAFFADGSITPLDFVNNERATATNAPTVSSKPLLGQTIHFIHSNSDCITWSFARPTAWTACTMLTIVQLNTITNNLFLNNSKGFAGGCQLSTSAVGVLAAFIGNQGAVNSTITLVTGVPYAIAASVVSSAGVINFAVKRLDTGAVSTSTTTTAFPLSAGNGVFSSGGDTTANGYDCDVAASVITGRPSSLSALVQWVNDPWAIFQPVEMGALGPAPAAAMPTSRPRDWPNPTLRKFATTAYLGHTSANRLALTVPNVQPFNQDDWPNPIISPARRPPVPQAARTFAPLVVFPENQYDWPNPVLRKFSAAYFGYTSTNRLALTVPNRQPAFTTHQPNPTIRQSRVHLDIGQSNLLPLTAMPVGRPQDIPNPPLRASRGLTVDTPASAALLAPTPAPFGQDDWPNPIVRPSRAHLLDTLYVNTALTAPTPPPFSQDDWPNPTGRASRVHLELGPSNMLPLTGQPFSQDDWPNPTLRPSRAHLDLAPPNLLPLTAPTVPFSQEDWPNPIIRWSPVPRQDYTGPNLALAVPNVQPFHQNDWQNPVRPWNPAAYQGFATGPNLALLAPNVQPFNQQDWPNPTPRWSPATRQDSISSINIALRVPNVQPFNQPDWPNPVRRVGHVAHQGFVAGPSLALVASQAQPPFAQLDWPNPRPMPRANLGFATGNITALTAPGNPFAQHDWLNPRAARASSVHLGFVSTLNTALAASGPRPFAQYDWPNPRGPARHPAYAGFLDTPQILPTIGSGHGTSTGTGTASAVGAATAAGSGTATGTGTAAGVGAVTKAAAGTAAGSGAAIGHGATTAAGHGASTGTGAATAHSAATVAGAGLAAGLGAASGTIVNLQEVSVRIGDQLTVTVQLLPPVALYSVTLRSVALSTVKLSDGLLEG